MRIFEKIIKRNLQITVLLLICSTIVLGKQESKKDNQDSKPYRFIFSINLFHNQKTEDAKASTTILMNKLKKDKDIKEDFEIIICNSEKEILDEIKSDFDFLLVTAVEMAAVRKSGRAKPVLINQSQNSYGFVYYLITNTENEINKIEDLKDGSINVLARAPGQVPSIWLDKLLRDHKFPTKELFFKDINYDNNATNVVLSVFFNKVSASIVSKASFELLCELNPEIQKKIKIIEVSKALLFGVVHFMNKNSDKKREKLVYDTLLDLDKDAYGKQLLSMFNVEKIVPYREEYSQNFLQLYK